MITKNRATHHAKVCHVSLLVQVRLAHLQRALAQEAAHMLHHHLSSNQALQQQQQQQLS
jgi:hypothetical protein